MQIDLRPGNDTLIIKLGENDNISAKNIQTILRDAGIGFTTLSAAGIWEVEASSVESIQEVFSRFNPTWSTEATSRLTRVRQVTEEQQDSESRSRLFKGHTLSSLQTLNRSPFPEQIEASTYMSAPSISRFALFWRPGSGKTGALLMAAHELLYRGIVRGVLIVAERPIAMKDPWQTEMNAWLSELSATRDRIAFVEGTRTDRLEIYLSDPTWLIVHYGLLWTDQFAIKHWAIRNEAEERPVVIFDESDLIKNSSALRSRAALTIRQECGRCWIASGTPAPHSPLDYEHQMSVLCGYPVELSLTGQREEDALVVIHELEKGVYYLQQDNPRKMPETIIPVKVNLSESHRRIYEQLIMQMIAYLRSIDDTAFQQERASIMAQRIKLLRFCSDPAHETLGYLNFEEPAKAMKLDMLLEEILSDPREKVVVWTRFRDTAIKLRERYRSRYGATLLIGGEEGDASQLNEPTCRMIVATIQMGASSISLTAARNAIYESLDDVSRNFIQSMARINRTGQTLDCRYWVLMCKDTLEEELFDRTLDKVKSSEDVLQEIGIPGRAQLIEQLRRGLTLSTN
ncbi:hypothetical protein ES707_15488 [subsurface metagenome]